MCCCCCCCFSEGETRKFYLFLKKEKKKIKRTRNATCWKSIPGERELSGGWEEEIIIFVREWNRKSGYGEEGRRGFLFEKLLSAAAAPPPCQRSHVRFPVPHGRDS
jgi:hypothetical protein